MKNVYVPRVGVECPSQIPSDKVAFAANYQYPSKYKQLKSYTLGWRCRLMFEACAQPCMFITYTFDVDKYIDPETDADPDGRVAWLKRTWQLFDKRLRINLDRAGLYNKECHKYYTISERGDDGRLHFHTLFYGYNFETFKTKNKKGQWIDAVKFSQLTDLIEKSWGLGFVFFEGVHPKNIRYVTKYLHKRKISGDYISLKSQGIGLSFLDPAKVKFFKENDQTHYRIGGKIYFLPRYLKSKIWTDPDEYREMSRKLMAELEEKYAQKVRNTPGVDQNRHYVVYGDSREILHSAWRQENLLERRHLIYGPARDAISHDEILPQVAEVLGYEYDPSVDDELRIWIVDEVDPDIVRWHHLRDRQNENFMMKKVYDYRL